MNDTPQEPQQNTTMTTPEQVKPAKRGRPLSWVIGGLAGFIIGALGTYFLLSAFMPRQNDQPETVTPQPVASVLKPEDITSRIREAYASEYTILNLDENNQPQEDEISLRIEALSPAHQTSGYDYYLTYDGGSTIDLVPHDPSNLTDLPSENSRSIRNKIASIYTEVGLERKITPDRQDIDTYEGEGLVCTIESPDVASSSNSASCGQLDAYPAAAATIKPFADALSSEHTIDATTFLSLPTLEDKADGYQNASLTHGSITGGGSGVALFWKKADGQWQFFIGTQGLLPCDKFDSDDLRNAFNGHACWDAASETQITVS